MLPVIIATVSVEQCDWWAEGRIMLPAIIAAISGLFGVGVGCFLSARLSKRNWQLGKAAEAYANLLSAGRREIILLQHIEYGHVFTPDYVNEIESTNKKLGGKVDSLAFRYLEEAWFFEKNADLQSRLENFRDGYEKYRAYARLEGEQSEADTVPEEKRNKQYEKTCERRQKKIDAYTGPKGEQLLSQLDELKNDVAKKYFH